MNLTSDEIIAKAKKGEDLNEHMQTEDRCLYHAIRWVLSQYAAGRITADKAGALRQKYLREWEQDKKVHAADLDLLRQTSDAWVRAESLVAAYNKDKSVENADKVFAVIYGVKEY